MDKKIITPADGMITLPLEVLEHIKSAGNDELKVLIYFFANPAADKAAAARDLGITAAAVDAAYAYWRGAGIFRESEADKKKVAFDASSYRNYDSETLSQAIEKNSEFSMICDLAGKKLGKQLTKNDYSSLFYLYDFVGMPAPVICGVIEECCNNGKKSLQYIFKKTVGLYDDGIDSYDKFESYMARVAAVNSNIGRLRQICGMGERALTAKEQKMFDHWFGEWAIPFDMVRLAYEKTVDGTGKLSFTYMNGILKRWHESGFATLDDIAKGDAARKNDNNQSSFAEDEFIAAALNRGFDD